MGESVTERFIKRQTVRGDVVKAKASLTKIIDGADGEMVSVAVVDLERVELALQSAAVALIGT